MDEQNLANKNKLVITKAAKPDAKAIIEYIETISEESDYLTFGKGEFNVTVEQEENFIEDISKQNNALFIIAEVDGKIVGNLNFSGGARPRVLHTGEFGVSVLKEYWGQGIGTKLAQYLIDWAKQSGIIRKINLRVRSDNYSAIHMYKKLGFTEEGRIRREFFMNNRFYDSIFMGLSID